MVADVYAVVGVGERERRGGREGASMVVVMVVVGGRVMRCWQRLCALSCTAAPAVPSAIRVLTMHDHLV